jgi:hypothetical protein
MNIILASKEPVTNSVVVEKSEKPSVATIKGFYFNPINLI